jgi:hypothetical protein
MRPEPESMIASAPRTGRNENVALREDIVRSSMFEEIVGSSEPLRQALVQVSKVAPTDTTVLILLRPLRRVGGSFAILRAALQVRMPLRWANGFGRTLSQHLGTEFQAVVARKGDSYETADSNQGWTSRPEPQHDRSLTVLGHVPIPRSEVMAESFLTS